MEGMRNNIIGRTMGLIGLILTAGLLSAACQDYSFETLSILSYNVQNLFDDVDDGTEYDEFDPGRGEWGEEQFHAKLRRLAEVLRQVEGGLPDIVVLQEVENKNAVDVLLRHYLDDGGYRHVVMVPVAGSAIQLAVLSRPEVVSVHSHRVYPGSTSFLQRDILEIEFGIGHYPLILFANHWKSKRGGAAATEEARRAAARVIVRRLEAILIREPQAEVVLVGDLNEGPEEYRRVGKKYVTALMPVDTPEGASEDSLLVSFDPPASETTRPVFYSPWGDTQVEGSYWHAAGNRWERIDHFLLSAGLFDQQGRRFDSFMVIDAPNLLDSRGHPYRFDAQTGRGYSDHLPILLILN